MVFVTPKAANEAALRLIPDCAKLRRSGHEETRAPSGVPEPVSRAPADARERCCGASSSTDQQLKDELLLAMVEAGTPERFIHAFLKTGIIPMLEEGYRAASPA